MKHLRMLALLVMATASLMALASGAAATPVLTLPAGTEYTGEIQMSLEESLTENSSVFTETCTAAEIHGQVTTNSETHAEGPITGLRLGGCSASEVRTLSNGESTINDSAEVFNIGSKVTVRKLGVSCIYGGTSAGTKLGTLTGGTTATVDIAASLPKQEGSGGLCGANASLTGKSIVTVPGTLLIT